MESFSESLSKPHLSWRDDREMVSVLLPRQTALLILGSTEMELSEPIYVQELS